MLVGLIDLDSILYTSVYRCVSISQIKEMLCNYEKDQARQLFLETVFNESLNRCENQLLKIKNQVQSLTPIEITSWELYITTCSNSFRKKLSTTYKSNRKRNKYVEYIRNHYSFGGAFCSDIFEADDLIARRAKQLDLDSYVIISIDKDLKQVPGLHWSYYTQKSFDFFGEPVLNDYGDQATEFKQKEIYFIEPKEADKIFWTSMLVGDSGDNIKGVKGIGLKGAEKLLTDSKNLFMTVARTYLSKSNKNDFRINYKLLKLK